MAMLENGTKVTYERREATIKAHRKVPRSSPVAFQYLIEYDDGNREWVGRYDVKTSEARGPRARGTDRGSLGGKQKQPEHVK